MRSPAISALMFSAIAVAGTAFPQVSRAATRAESEQIEQCTALRGAVIFEGMASVVDAAVSTVEPTPYCIVQANFGASDLKVQVRLPIQRWNGKLLYIGGGGWNGTLRPFGSKGWFGSKSAYSEGYAQVVSNGGHDAPPGFALNTTPNADWARDPVKLLDYAMLSVHRALPVARDLVRKFYGTVPSRQYFEGCSYGGHEAMMEAQRFPKDFDGIVARAPAFNFTAQIARFNLIARQATSPAGYINEAKRDLLANAILNSCDGDDGIKDGILSKPAACKFRAASLRCPQGADSGNSCLSDQQIATVETIISPWQSKDGSLRFSGYEYGLINHPKGWNEYVWPIAANGNRSIQDIFSSAFIRDFVTLDPQYDTSNWNPDEWLPSLRHANMFLQATDSDLSPFFRNGGKLILWNGEADSSVSSKDLARYYGEVTAKLGSSDTNKFVELFLAPGVGHCLGGVGPDKVDLLKALDTWVEKNTPPSAQALKHEKLDEQGKVLMSRPVCKFPAYPRYNGKGDPNVAGNFSCVSD